MAVSLTGTDLHLGFGTNKVLRGVDLHVDGTPLPRPAARAAG